MTSQSNLSPELDRADTEARTPRTRRPWTAAGTRTTPRRHDSLKRTESASPTGASETRSARRSCCCSTSWATSTTTTRRSPTRSPAGREVILTDNAGVGLSTGTAPETVAGMARDAASLIDALGLEHVDLFGFSMGGFVAQQIAVDRPELVRRLVLVGTGPRGGEGMGQLDPDVAPLFGTAYDPQDLMWLPIFFSPSGKSQAAGRAVPRAHPGANRGSRRPGLGGDGRRSSRGRARVGSGCPGRATTTSSESVTRRSWSTAATTSSSPPSTPTSCSRTCQTPN